MEQACKRESLRDDERFLQPRYPRLLTDFFNPNKYKFNTYPDNPVYKTNKPDAETYKRLRLYLVHAFTSIGAPHIWNGEEMGMWGADDPHPRKPLMWKEFTFEPETKDNYRNKLNEFDAVAFNQQQFDFYKELIAIRKANPVLVSGELEFIKAEGKLLGYRRFLGKDEIVILFNVSDVKALFSLTPGNVYRYLWGGKGTTSNSISINTLESVILKKI
jgi:cyclomaltodextrinase